MIYRAGYIVISNARLNKVYMREFVLTHSVQHIIWTLIQINFRGMTSKNTLDLDDDNIMMMSFFSLSKLRIEMNLISPLVLVVFLLESRVDAVQAVEVYNSVFVRRR